MQPIEDHFHQAGIAKMFSFNQLLRPSLAACLIVFSGRLAVSQIVVVHAKLEPSQHVFAPALEAGQITRLLVQEGEYVEAGQLLATLDDKLTQTAVDVANLELDIAEFAAAQDFDLPLFEHARANALKQLERAKQLIISGAITPEELEERELDLSAIENQIAESKREYESARLNLRLKQQKLKEAQHQQQRTKVVAPTSGIVGKLLKQPGEWIGRGESVIRLEDRQRLTTRIQVPVEQWHPDWLSSPIEVAISGHAITAMARVVRVNRRMADLTGQVVATLELDTPEQFSDSLLGASQELVLQKPELAQTTLLTSLNK